MPAEIRTLSSQPESEPVTVRPAQPDDMPAVYELMKAVLLEVYAPRYPQVRAWGEERYGARNSRPETCHLFLVAECQGRIVGCVMLALHRIFNLYIEGSWRSKGLGSRLLDAAEQRLRERGFAAAALEVAQDFPEVVAFYRERGWHLTAQRHKIARDVPVVVMSKRLSTGRIGALWLACQGLVRPALIAVISVASYPYAGLFLGTGGLPQWLLMALWAVMATLSIRNLLTVPAEIFCSMRYAAFIGLGTILQVAVLQSVPTVAVLMARMVELPTGRYASGILSAVVGLAIVLHLLSDFLRRPMTRAWRHFGLEIPN